MPTPVKKAAAKRASAPTPTGAQVLIAQLEVLGVEVVFGIPGVHNLSIFDALRRSSIRTVLVRHEGTAAYAADGYARATGRLGVCVTTTGPGAANAAAAMGEARAARSPVLHISTQIESRLLEGKGGRWSLHESPRQQQLMGAVAIWSASVARAEAIATLVQRAAHEAVSGRRGPVFLDIPHDFLDQPVHWEASPGLKERVLPPDPKAIARAASMLGAAKRPLIWAGGGAIASGAGEAVARVAEAIAAPVVTTFAGKGLLGAGHPLAVDLPPHEPLVSKLIGSSDAVLVVGSDLDGMNTQGWRAPIPKPRVSINTIASDGRRNYACDLVIEADARASLEMLLPMLKPRARATVEKRVAKVRADADAALRASKEFAEPYAFVRAIESVLPAGAVVLADMAVGGYWAAGYMRVGAPHSFAYPLGWGTLGFALPAAVGVAASGKRAVVICGDAGFMYAAGELATLVQEELPVTVIVVNDEGYGMLRFDERERFGREFASDLHVGDLVAMAKAFGLKARRAEPDDVAAALRWAFKLRVPALVEVRARFAPPLTTSPRWPLKGAPEARP